jgi:hypothetical protein
MLDVFVKPYVPFVDEVMDEYGPTLGRVFDRLTQYMCENTVKSIRYYEGEVLDRKEAILLTINSNAALAEAIKNMGNNKKK